MDLEKFWDLKIKLSVKNGLLCLRSARSNARSLNIVLSIAQALAILTTLLQYFGSLGESYEKKFFLLGPKASFKAESEFFSEIHMICII